MDSVESDLRNTVIKSWRRGASDRTERAYVMKENEGKLNAVVLKKNIKNNKSYDRDANSFHLSPVEMVGHVPFCL